MARPVMQLDIGGQFLVRRLRKLLGTTIPASAGLISVIDGARVGSYS